MATITHQESVCHVRSSPYFGAFFAAWDEILAALAAAPSLGGRVLGGMLTERWRQARKDNAERGRQVTARGETFDFGGRRCCRGMLYRVGLLDWQFLLNVLGEVPQYLTGQEEAQAVRAIYQRHNLLYLWEEGEKTAKIS